MTIDVRVTVPGHAKFAARTQYRDTIEGGEVRTTLAGMTLPGETGSFVGTDNREVVVTEVIPDDWVNGEPPAAE